MVGENIAVIDLGTNSFHLLIAKVEEYGFEKLLKKKLFVRLAERGLDSIPYDKFELGLSVLATYSDYLKEFNVKQFKAFGTAGLRTAKNGGEFVKQAKELYNIPIELIDGEREAQLIYEGVNQAVDLNTKPDLIMDIGGGSTEFVIANKDEVFWKRSYPIGAAVLKSRFHHCDPLSNDEYVNLVNFLNEELSELWENINKYSPKTLIGASGSFKALVNIQRNINGLFPGFTGTSEIVNLSSFKVTHLRIIKSTLDQRLKVDALEPERAPMMPVATTLMSVVLSHLKPTRSIVVSSFALKEGMLKELSEVNADA